MIIPHNNLTFWSQQIRTGVFSPSQHVWTEMACFPPLTSSSEKQKQHKTTKVTRLVLPQRISDLAGNARATLPVAAFYSKSCVAFIVVAT